MTVAVGTAFSMRRLSCRAADTWRTRPLHLWVAFCLLASSFSLPVWSFSRSRARHRCTEEAGASIVSTRQQPANRLWAAHMGRFGRHRLRATVPPSSLRVDDFQATVDSAETGKPTSAGGSRCRPARGFQAREAWRTDPACPTEWFQRLGGEHEARLRSHAEHADERKWRSASSGPTVFATIRPSATTACRSLRSWCDRLSGGRRRRGEVHSRGAPPSWPRPPGP